MKVYVIMKNWCNCGEYEEYDWDIHYLGLARSLEDVMAIVNKDVQTIKDEEQNISNVYGYRVNRFELTMDNNKNDDGSVNVVTLLHGTVYKHTLNEDYNSYESRYYYYEEEL